MMAQLEQQHHQQDTLPQQMQQQQDLTMPPSAQIAPGSQTGDMQSDQIQDDSVVQMPNPEYYAHANNIDEEQQPQMVQYKVKRRPKSMRKKTKQRQHADTRNSCAPEWNERFFVTTSSNNTKLHQFFREYFDKKPGSIETSFRVKYANSSNELPGITAVGSRTHSKVKEYMSIPEKAHQNVKKLMNETRMPIKKGQSKAYPSAKKHFRLANGWQSDFVVMSSQANGQVYKDKREFFDKPVNYQTGMGNVKNNTLKPMEVYHKITPVRSIQQSINLIRALKNEQKDEIQKTRPKSVAANYGTYSDTYGQIPNLRDSVNPSHTFLPVKKSLKKFDREAYSTASPELNSFAQFRHINSSSQAQTEGKGLPDQAATGASWAPSKDGLNNVSNSQALMARTDGLTVQSQNFQIRNTRRKMKKRRFATNKKNSQNAYPGSNEQINDNQAMAEYGFVNPDQVHQLNSQSQGSLQSNPVDVAAQDQAANQRASQAENPLSMASIEKPEEAEEQATK